MLEFLSDNVSQIGNYLEFQMTYPSHKIGLIAAAGSAALLAGAWIFQALGYAPCPMCIWQRYPHAIAVLIGLVVLVGLRFRFVYLFGAATVLVTAAIGVFHAGVERKWWQGPTSCTGTGLDLPAEDLLSTDTPVNLVMCDQVAWQFLTLSMASWNAAFSFVIVGVWIFAFLKKDNSKP
ncbi:disulfide bond formation protein B [Nereida ignava]|uniref:disulfide bond formation protein B n=1 Tax=Nereida ignava TaxID=282199 RepID=UPI003F6BB417